MSTQEGTVSSPMRSSHPGQRVVAAETHPPASFTMLPMDEYKLLLASICPFLFVHLGSISPHLHAQLELYVDYELFKLFMFPPVSLVSRKRC